MTSLILPPSLTLSQITEKKRWFDARDTFLGNFSFKIKRDMTKGLKMAAELVHNEDARWLCSLFPTGTVFSEEDAIQVFNAEFNKMWNSPDFRFDFKRNKATIAKCQCYAAFLGGVFEHINWFDHACLLEDPLALGFKLDHNLERDRSSNWPVDEACRSAMAYEPAGLYALGCYFYHNRNDEKTKWCLKLAAQLGNPHASYAYGCLLPENNPERYKFMGWTWCLFDEDSHSRRAFLNSVCKLVTEHRSDHGKAPKAIFQIGATLRYSNYHERKIGYANIHAIGLAIDLYIRWCEKAKMAVDAWLIVSRRLKFHKDMRRVIGEMVWAGRSDAEYDLEK